MSQFSGFMCDACGKVFRHGVSVSGDKRRVIEGGRTRCAYRFDLCDECFKRMMRMCGAEKAFEEEGK